MQNNLDPRDDLEPTARTPKSEPAAEHEVMPSHRISDAVHAWLDGEPVNEAALSAAPREVAFWKKMDAETSSRRRMVTPPHVPAQILAKLPEKR